MTLKPYCVSIVRAWGFPLKASLAKSLNSGIHLERAEYDREREATLAAAARWSPRLSEPPDTSRRFRDPFGY